MRVRTFLIDLCAFGIIGMCLAVAWLVISAW